MRAVRMHGYGDASVLRLEEVAPLPLGPRDVRVRVRASAVNPVDHKIRSGGQRAVVRLRLPWTLGMDVSGVVTEVGAKVRGFSVGDEVFASPSHRRMGGYAEEVVIRASECAIKPASLTHEEAASLPLVGLTAWQALDALRVKPGQRVVIQAGAGGVGSVAIQLAKHRGAEVLATCSTRNVELVESLGADRAIDYRRERWDEVARGCDAVLESIGGEHVPRAVHAVRRGGRVASITPGLPKYTERYGAALGLAVFGVTIAGHVIGARVRRNVALSLVTRRPDGGQLAALGRLADAGVVRPLVEKVYALEDAQEAHRHVETGRTRGKVVLAVGV